MYLRLITFFIIIISADFVQANDLQKADSSLAKDFKNIIRLLSQDKSYNTVSEVVNKFESDLIDVLERHPESINFDFKELKKDLLIITSSSDENLKTYSWGLSMKPPNKPKGIFMEYVTICQYRTSNNTQKIEVISDKKNEKMNFSCFSIDELKTSDGNVYLLKLYTQQYNKINFDDYLRYKVFTINSDSLQPANIIETSNFQETSELGLLFNSGLTRGQYDNLLNLIKFNKSNNTIKIRKLISRKVFSNSFEKFKYDGALFKLESRSNLE